METTNNAGTNNNKQTANSRKRYATVSVFGEPITKNVLVRVPAETNSFMKLINPHELENGRRIEGHYKFGKKVLSSDQKTSVVMNMHFYGFGTQHLGKSMVANVKIVRMTRGDGKTFVHLDIYRQKAGTEAERILTITNEDKGILINGTDARILFIKAQPRPVKAEASAEAGTATAPETLAKETAAETSSVAETAAPEIADPGTTDTGKKSKKREYDRDKAPKAPKKKKSRIAKYEFKEVSADKPKIKSRKSYQQTPEQKKTAILAEAKENNWTVVSQTTTEIVLDLGNGMTITRSIG